MALINVNRSLNDQFYRYKMPKLVAKVEGKGNGIKTVIVNMTDIAKSLGRPPTYPTKYFGCELGSQTQFDTKKDRYIVNGQHDANKLQDILDGFIKKYVLCPNCDNPETVLTALQKRQIITTKCKACGHSGTLETNHKLNTFIIKNPPDGSVAPTNKKEEKKSKKKGKKDDSPNNSAGEQDNGDNNTNGNDRDDNSEENDDGWGDDDDWGSQPQTITAMDGLSMKAKGLMLDDDIEKTQQDRVNIFYDFVKKRLPVNSSHYKEIVAESERLEIKETAPLVLCELLVDQNAVVCFKQHHILFRCFTDDSKKAQKYILGGVELVIKLHPEDLLPKTSVILGALFELQIIDEDVLLDWAKKQSKKYVGKEMAEKIHEKAEKFITWLKEAEEESSSEEEEDERDVEIEYDDRHASEGLREIKEPAKTNGVTTNGKPKEDEDDDLDIDAI